MIGYHYTLVKNLDSILSIGLLLRPLTADNYKSFSEPFYVDFPTEGIYVFRKKLTGIQAYLILAWLSLGRNDYNICLLEVKYNKEDTQQRFSDDTVIFHDTFSVIDGGVEERIRFDLILEPVPPENIKVVKTWNLLEL
ncbi:hypothetical protein LCGC14_2049360 [marine sediment metagenome]|uniref:Uncharacterized protein n=1 Tax=marine sediment metagenome TaxID=412755 RepID=A0A0F9EPM0_9ZZZZ